MPLLNSKTFSLSSAWELGHWKRLLGRWALTFLLPNFNLNGIEGRAEAGTSLGKGGSAGILPWASGVLGPSLFGIDWSKHIWWQKCGIITATSQSFIHSSLLWYQTRIKVAVTLTPVKAGKKEAKPEQWIMQGRNRQLLCGLGTFLIPLVIPVQPLIFTPHKQSTCGTLVFSGSLERTVWKLPLSRVGMYCTLHSLVMPVPWAEAIVQHVQEVPG